MVIIIKTNGQLLVSSHLICTQRDFFRSEQKQQLHKRGPALCCGQAAHISQGALKGLDERERDQANMNNNRKNGAQELISEKIMF